MKIQLKSVKIINDMEDGYASSANIYVDGKKVGYTENRGQGGPTTVEFDNKTIAAKVLAKAPTLLESVNERLFELIITGSAKGVYGNVGMACMEGICDILVNDSVTIKNVAPVKKKVSVITTDCKKGERVTYKIKPEQLTAGNLKIIQSKPDFVKTLHDLSYTDIAIELGVIDKGDSLHEFVEG